MGQLTISLLTESQEGTIGNDWKYSLGVKVFNGGKVGEGSVGVAKHQLDSGKVQTPPGPPEALSIPAGPAGSEASIEIRLAVEEVDLFQNDKGETVTSFKLQIPAAGAAPYVEERELSVGVTEEPSGIGTAVFKLMTRMELSA